MDTVTVPLAVPLVDQEGITVGTHFRQEADLLREHAFRDENGIVWTAPTAGAYYAVCKAREEWADRSTQAERLLAIILDDIVEVFGPSLRSDKIATLTANVGAASAFLDSKMGKRP